MATSRNASTKQIGTQNNAVAVGGSDPTGNLNYTEQFTGTGIATKTITTS